MELTKVQRTRWLTTHAYDLTPLQGLSLYMCTPPVSNPWYPQRTSHSILTWQEIELIPIENNCLIIEPLIHSGYECQCPNVCIYANNASNTSEKLKIWIWKKLPPSGFRTLYLWRANLLYYQLGHSARWKYMKCLVHEHQNHMNCLKVWYLRIYRRVKMVRKHQKINFCTIAWFLTTIQNLKKYFFLVVKIWPVEFFLKKVPRLHNWDVLFHLQHFLSPES